MMINTPKPWLRPLYIMAISLAFVIVSCGKDDPETNDVPSRLFRPVQFSAEVNGNNVLLTWVPIKGASYAIELMREGAADAPQTFAIDSAASFLLENLYSETTYEVTIKAISTIPGITDSEEQQLSFETGTENIFFEIPDVNISTDQVLLQWDPAKQVSAIVVSADGIADNHLSLSPAEITAGEKQVTGLQPGTAYTFRIYLNDMLRGTISASTHEN